MFTIDFVLEILKRLFGSIVSFLWKYKGWILLGVIIGALYVRGNNYKEDYQEEVVSHIQTVVKYDKEIDSIKLANEKALRIAQEELAENYKALVEKTSLIQEKYNERNKDISTTINSLNSSNNSLHETIKDFTKRDTNSYENNLRDTSSTSSLQLTGELLAECVERKQYYGTEASKLQNSVTTLQEWGHMVIENSEKVKGELNVK